MFKLRILLLCITAVLALLGCNSQTEGNRVEKEEKDVFYEDHEAGLKIYESSDWILDSEVSKEPFNATFKQKDVRAIVSIIPGTKSLQQLKTELKLDRDFVKVIEESEHHISFQMNKKERLRSDIYTEQTGDETLIVTFLTPLSKYEANQHTTEEFRNNIELLH